MKRSFPVIDADGHILERDRELRQFLPAEFRAVPGKREYPLFSWDGWARGTSASIRASSFGCAFSMPRKSR
jgi:hypothetical protein